MKRKLVYVCLLAMVAGGMMSFSYDIPEKQETGGREDRVISFPGAEGHGRYTTGGRGGKVYHVTSLEDDGSQGTLRWALKQNGPKTIVFDVAGTIHLKSELRTGKDHLTIAGQTSPGGICLADYGFSINSNNVIIRFLRFRPGEASGKEPDGLGGCDKKDIMVDHCSVSWSVDECLSVYGMENSTVQWCIGSEALRKATHVKGAHGYGGNWGGHKASYHHNLIAHCESRVPRLGPRPSTLALGECVDIRNNVFYNWAGNGCYGLKCGISERRIRQDAYSFLEHLESLTDDEDNHFTREANTTLSKANDIEISNAAIDLKTEIEKVREQIQNIE